MSLKTHRALVVAGTSDAATMKRRNITPAGKFMFLGCDEGSGSDLFDYGNAGIKVTATAAPDWTNPLLPSFYFTTAAPAVGSVVNLSPTNKAFMAFFACKPAAATSFTLSTATPTGLNLVLGGSNAGTNGCGLGAFAGTGTTAGLTIAAFNVFAAWRAANGNVQPNGHDQFIAMSYDPNAAAGQHITFYGGVDALALETYSFDKGAYVDSVLTNQIGFNTSAAAQPIYGAGFRVFAGGLPADFAAGLAELRTQLLAGEKDIMRRWLTLA
jgi:hypothetical protein